MWLNRAGQAIFARVRRGETPGYPKCKASRRWKTIEMAQPTAGMVQHGNGNYVVEVDGIPTPVLKLSRELPDSGGLKTRTKRGSPLACE